MLYYVGLGQLLPRRGAPVIVDSGVKSDIGRVRFAAVAMSYNCPSKVG
jgi:hypothetical protein